jgi:hypothetical protein
MKMSTKINAVESNRVFTIGCVSKSLRGPVDGPVALTTIADDRRIFGEPANAFIGGHIRRGIFNSLRLAKPSTYNGSLDGLYNARVHTVRVLASNAVVATLTLVDDTAETPGDSWVVTSAYLGRAVPGVDGNKVKVEIQVNADDADTVDLLVYYKGPSDDDYVLRETHEALDNSNVVATVNPVSEYVKVAIAADATKVPAVVAATALATGADGDAVDAADYATALALLDSLHLPIVINADEETAQVATYATAQSSTVEDVAGIFGASLATLVPEFNEFLDEKEYFDNRVETVTLGFRSMVHGHEVEPS